MKWLKWMAGCAAALALLVPSIGTMAQETITIHHPMQPILIEIQRPPQEEDSPKTPFAGNRPAVDVAVLLDTSNSMDGLINQAKTQLWSLVQEFAEAKKNGQTPALRVAVFEYGNTNLPASEGYIRQVVSLTNDLDKVSEGLFALTTNGGDEYCGMVIDEAIKRLDWSTEPGAYKAIFIAGNEPFTQGSVDYQSSCRNAIQKGVVVNTIHCGNRKTGIQGKWEHGAQLAEGEFMNIDQDRRVVQIKCPQDKIIIELNNKLNKTYLWFGDKQNRKAWTANQVVQDENAAKSGSIQQRGLSKASSVYDNRGRCLVDTYAAKPDEVLKIKVAELPEAMQKMTPDQRVAHVKTMAAERDAIKKQIRKVSEERARYLVEQQKKAGKDNSATWGAAMNAAVRKQLDQSGFSVKKTP